MAQRKKRTSRNSYEQYSFGDHWKFTVVKQKLTRKQKQMVDKFFRDISSDDNWDEALHSGWDKLKEAGIKVREERID
jgi:hypothetical protein